MYKTTKRPVGIRLSEDDKAILEALAQKTLRSQSNVIALALREMARQENLALSDLRIGATEPQPATT